MLQKEAEKVILRNVAMLQACNALRVVQQTCEIFCKTYFSSLEQNISQNCHSSVANGHKKLLQHGREGEERALVMLDIQLGCLLQVWCNCKTIIWRALKRAKTGLVEKCSYISVKLKF